MPPTPAQRKVIVAAFLGWMLDAFDFFLLVFALPSIAASFQLGVPTVAYAIFLTLAMRLVGAFVFGRLGDRSCTIFAGKTVAAAAWCKAWSKKAGT